MALYFGNKKYSLSIGSSQGTLHLNSKVRLPNIYQEVSYLEAEVNTETYIDLGFTFDTSAEIYITQIVPNGAVTSYLFGAVEKEGILRCCLSSPYGQAATLYGSNTTAYGSSVVGFNGLHGLNEYKIIIKKGNREIINLTTGKTSGISSGQGEYTMTSNLYLFAQNYNGTVRYGSKRIISAFKYYDKNGDLICDLIPCYRKSDNVRGMYDTARKIFLTNIGTGADFTIGELINKSNNLLNLDRKQAESYTSSSGWADNSIYLNPASFSSTNPVTGNPCVISNLTSNSITVTEPGLGGYGVAYGMLIYNNYIDKRGKSYTLTWDATGTTNTRFRLMVSDGSSLTYIPLDVGSGTVYLTTISISKGGKIITINGVNYTFTNNIAWMAFHFSSATGTTTSYKNVRLIENKVINEMKISINTNGGIYNNGLGYKDHCRVRSGGDEEEYTDDTPYVCTGFIPFKKWHTVDIYPAFYGGNADNAINLFDSNFNNLGQFTDYRAKYGICEGYENYKATTENSITSFTLTDEHNDSDKVAYIRITHVLGSSSKLATGKQLYVQVDRPPSANLLNMNNRTIYTEYTTDFIETNESHSMDYTKIYATDHANRRGSYATSKFTDFTVLKNNGFSANCSSSSGYRLEFPLDLKTNTTYELTVTSVGDYCIKLLKYNADTTYNSYTDIITKGKEQKVVFKTFDNFKYSISFPFTSGIRSYENIKLIEKSFSNYADPTSAEWLSNARLGSDGTIKYDDTAMGCDLTNFIGPLMAGDIIDIKGLNLSGTTGGYRSAPYKANKTIHGSYGVSQLANFGVGNVTCLSNLTITPEHTQFTNTKNDVVYWRFGGKLTGAKEDVVITITRPTNFANPSSPDWQIGYRLTETAFKTTTSSGSVVTNFVNVQKGDIVKVEGIDFTHSGNRQTFSYNDSPIGISTVASWDALETQNTITDIVYDNKSFQFRVTYNDSSRPIIQARFSGQLVGTAEEVRITIIRNDKAL